jgi:hypothetical protein
VTKKTVPGYNPQLTPEKKVLDEKHKLLKYMKGTKGCTRMGEQYILTCTCQAYQVTSDDQLKEIFLEDHRCCSER